MNGYQKIKSRVLELLAPLGYAEEMPDTADGAGATQCILARGAKKFMLQWDVVEGMGSVEAWVDGDWAMLDSIVPESPEPKFSDCLNSLCEELKSHL
jgi:hypothetical protein